MYIRNAVCKTGLFLALLVLSPLPNALASQDLASLRRKSAIMRQMLGHEANRLTNLELAPDYDGYFKTFDTQLAGLRAHMGRATLALEASPPDLRTYAIHIKALRDDARTYSEDSYAKARGANNMPSFEGNNWISNKQLQEVLEKIGARFEQIAGAAETYLL